MSERELRQLIYTNKFGRKTLDLGRKNLTKLPAAVSKLTELERLNFSWNKLSELPDNLCELTNLTWLYARDNKLTALPRTFCELKKLVWLDLSYNKLSALPGIEELKELEWLFVEGNPLTFEEMIKVMKMKNRVKLYVSVSDRVHEQRAEGQRTQQAYENALKDGFVRVFRGQVQFVGQDRAGKTSLKKSLLGLRFDPKEQSTEGIEVDTSQCEIEVDEVKNWHSTHENKSGLIECSKAIAKMVTEKLCQFEDLNFNLEEESDSEESDLVEKTVGQPSESDISSSSAKAEVSKQDNVSSGEHVIDYQSENEPDEPDVTIDATSPPDDFTQHVHQLLEYVKGNSVKCDITNEESVVSMDVWDFAGQDLYYASHPLFLSSRALYILVHNLSKPLHAPARPCVRQGACDKPLENPTDQTNLENLLSWLATICSIAEVKEETDDGAQGKLSYLRPPVIVVGTHADKPFEDIAVMKSQIQKGISGKEYEKHVVQPFFSIDNTTSLMRNRSFWTDVLDIFFGQGPKGSKHQAGQEGHINEIQELRNRIMEVLREQPHMGEKIPVRTES